MKIEQTFFVPINFSSCSYKAVQYATVLAKITGGKIVLFHVADLGDVRGSENPLVLSQNIDRAVSKADARLHSIKEIIAEAYNISVAHSVVIGNIQTRLLHEIHTSHPDVIIFGKEIGESRLLKKLLSQTQRPVFVVPESANIREPLRITLTTDLNPVKPETLFPMLKLARRTTRTVSLLHIKSPLNITKNHHKKWMTQLSEQFDLDTQISTELYSETVAGVLRHIQSNYTDLLCTVRREKGLLSKLFSSSISTQLASQADVPVLVMSEYSRVA